MGRGQSLDLCQLAEAERQGEALRLAEEEARRPLTWPGGRWCVPCWCGWEDQEHRLFLTLHRIIVDRASLTDVVLPELRELYEARVQGRPAELDEVRLQYADYATWQRRATA